MVYDQNPDGFTLVMATKGTLESENSINFIINIITTKRRLLPASVLRILLSTAQRHRLCDYLDKTLDEYKGKAQNVVLGCTHYPLAKRKLKTLWVTLSF